MEDSKKYELIVGLKELIISTHKNDINELYNNMQISLNASKVMRFIYSNKELEKIFVDIINEYEKYIDNISQLCDALTIRRKQIKEFQPLFDFDIDLPIFQYLDNEQSFNDIIDKQNKTPKDKELFAEYCKLMKLLSYGDFTIHFGRNQLHKSSDIITSLNDTMQFYENKGIFRFIDGFLSYYESKYIDKIDLTIDDSIAETFTVFDTNNYTLNLANYYDFYYLYKAEYTDFQKDLADIQSNLYLHVAYTKVLYDLLENLYTMDLSEEEKQDYKVSQIDTLLSQNRIYFDDYEEISDLNIQPRKLLQFIAISRNLNHLKEILKIKNSEYEHLTQTISEYLTKPLKDKGLIGERGGYTAIKELLNIKKEWFTPKVNKSN